MNKAYQPRLEEFYRNTLVAQLQKELALSNVMEVPKISKIVLNIGVKEAVSDSKVLKKIEEIITSDVEHYKNLRYDLKEYKRVHIGHFVLVFRYNKTENIISFDDLDHHDNIYKR